MHCRCLVRSESGEEAILTLSMQRQEELVPQYRTSPLIRSVWRLLSITGELEGDRGEQGGLQPGPEVAPEEVVQVGVRGMRRERQTA